jgi:hypothetical protein
VALRLARLRQMYLSPPQLLYSLVVAAVRRARFLNGCICHKHLMMLSLVLVVGLGGCSGSQVMDLYTADYRETGASSADAQLLSNILRAKDDLPIHFRDLSVIHGAIQWTAGAAAGVPLVQNGSMTPTTITPVLSLQNSPTFDLGTLDTQEFTRGMLTPVDPNIIKQLFDQGIDLRLLALLFVAEWRDPHGHVVLNNMSCDPLRPLKDGECYNRIYDFLETINDVFWERRHLYVNIYFQLTPLGGPLAGPWSLKDNLDPLLKFDPLKYKLKDKRLFSISGRPQLALCYEEGGHLKTLIWSPLGDQVCNKSEVVVPEEKWRQAGVLSLRSAYQIIQFLGQVLRFQEEKRINRCLTLDGKNRDCDTGEVLFQVNNPVGTPVVATRYGNEWYAINDRHCSKRTAGSLRLFGSGSRDPRASVKREQGCKGHPCDTKGSGCALTAKAAGEMEWPG